MMRQCAPTFRSQTGAGVGVPAPCAIAAPSLVNAADETGSSACESASAPPKRPGFGGSTAWTSRVADRAVRPAVLNVRGVRTVVGGKSVGSTMRRDEDAAVQVREVLLRRVQKQEAAEYR